MGLDLVEIWNNMSIIVKVITVLMVGMSVYMFYVIAERLLTYRAASDQSIRYVQALGEYLRQHKVNDALNSARGAQKSPVAKVMESGLTALLQGRDPLAEGGRRQAQFLGGLAEALAPRDGGEKGQVAEVH